MRLGPETVHSNEPDAFLERSLQARLAKIWNSILRPAIYRPLAYDPAAVEEHYDRLCREFLFKLPAAFDLHNPNKEWDLQRPMLARQRQMLRISVFALLCQIYRPVLLLNSAQINSMAQYKRCLVSRHRTTLANSAISLLDNIAQLHSDMGGNQTKYFLISFYTFEPAVLLIMHLLSAENISKTLSQVQATYERHPVLGALHALEDTAFSNPNAPSHSQCLAEIDKALLRLNTLREVSPIAELGGHKLHQMVDRLVLSNAKTGPETIEPESATRSHMTLDAQNEIGMDSEEERPFEQLEASTLHANDVFPDVLQDDWANDALGLTWNDTVASATDVLTTSGPSSRASKDITSADASKKNWMTTAPTNAAFTGTNASLGSMPPFSIPSPCLGTGSEISESNLSATSTRRHFDYPGNDESLYTYPENYLDMIQASILTSTLEDG